MSPLETYLKDLHEIRSTAGPPGPVPFRHFWGGQRP
jgi:hypothetical protein